MESPGQNPVRISGSSLFGRLAFMFLLSCSVGFGAAVGLLFVYTSDLPEIRALEDYRPDMVTELYADDGQIHRHLRPATPHSAHLSANSRKSCGTRFSTTEDQHFEEHWGVDFTRVVGAAWRTSPRGASREGASTITMQLAGGAFSGPLRSQSFHRKIQETLLAAPD